MSRHKSCEAIVLHLSPLSEIHANVTLLTREEGILRVIAHGVRGKKSSLRAQVQTYSRIRAYLYEDPQRQITKLTDAEVYEDFAAVRENLQAIYNAALCSEVLAKSSFHSEDTWAFDVLLDWLRNVAGSAAGTNLENATIQFMWRYLTRSGFSPDLRTCVQTGAVLEDSDKVAYSSSMGGFIALGKNEKDHESSSERSGSRIHVPAGALTYLRFTLAQEFAPAVQVGLAAESRHALIRLSLDLVQETLGFPLKTLRDSDLLFAPR